MQVWTGEYSCNFGLRSGEDVDDHVGQRLRLVVVLCCTGIQSQSHPRRYAEGERDEGMRIECDGREGR